MPAKVAIISDYPEENWPSMDLVAEMILQNLHAHHRDQVEAECICPQWVRRASRLALIGGTRPAFNADRVFNRFWEYPRWLRMRRARFDLFHVIDHSYAQLVHQLPPERTVLTCYDLNAFRCLLEPEREHRSTLYRRMARYALEGLRSAAYVICPTAAIRRRLVEAGLLPAERVVTIPLGVHPACTPRHDSEAARALSRLLGEPNTDSVELLHVGSTIPRKRIDILLRVFAAVRRKFPWVRLLRVGGPFTPQQAELARQLGLGDAVRVIPFLDWQLLAAMYRRAAMLLLPSESEGFGLPVVEAMACGTPVVASDIPVLQEVGGDAVTFCRLDDVATWSDMIVRLIRERNNQPRLWAMRRSKALARAALFSWREHTRRTVEIYRRLAGESSQPISQDQVAGTLEAAP